MSCQWERGSDLDKGSDLDRATSSWTRVACNRSPQQRTGRGGEREAQAPPAKGASAVGMCGRSGSMQSGDSLHDQCWTISDVH